MEEKITEFVHVLNPFNCAENSKAYKMQWHTLKGIEWAIKNYSSNSVELVSAVFEEDQNAFSSFFNKSFVIQKSTSLPNCKKLPFISEILNTTLHYSNAPYIIFTNMDIVPLPHFYTTIHELLKSKPEAVIINRRRISESFIDKSLTEILAQAGEPHPGFDCFVLKRELISKFILAEISTGVPFLEVSLLHNIIAFAQTYILEEHLHISTHIGLDVLHSSSTPLYKRNRNIYEKEVYPKIKHLLAAEKFPHYKISFFSRMIKYMLNPSYRTHQLLEFEGKSFFNKLIFILNEFRWKIVEK